MGCYETITFNCPNCGEELNAQSKSGPCQLDVYKHDSVPMSVAVDANRHAPFECVCGKKWAFVVPSFDDRIALKVVEQSS